MRNKFKFNEIVKIIKTKEQDKFIFNCSGKISSMGCDDYGNWNYGVFIFKTEEVWGFNEDDLISTGKFVDKDFNSSGESIKVVVDKKGRGSIKK